MAFTQKCFVRSNSPSMWRVLSGAGVKADPFGSLSRFGHDPECMAVADCGMAYGTKVKPDEGFYDCGDNVALFVALATLRDDSDFFQWFIYTKEPDEETAYERYWFRCYAQRLCDWLRSDIPFDNCEKASRLEIIYHFTGRDDDKNLE